MASGRRFWRVTTVMSELPKGLVQAGVIELPLLLCWIAFHLVAGLDMQQVN